MMVYNAEIPLFGEVLELLRCELWSLDLTKVCLARLFGKTTVVLP